ncbi:MAG: macro domain-containing protein [candidate division Zixibacteria bacterium]|nr:macro domain-containing protein [candidate division Zixibacteria bacterium]
MLIEKNFNDKKIILIQGDITDSETDAIVNTANNHLWMGSGVAGAIKAKGGAEIEKEAKAKGPIPIGEAVATSAGKLKAKYVIHAAVMGQDLQTNEKYIRAATLNSLKRAEELKLSSIAFPALGTGVGGFPMDKCADDMISTVAGFFRDNNFVKEVYFVLFKKEDCDVFTLVLERIWSDWQWSLKTIEVNQQSFSLLSKKELEDYFELLNNDEEILIEAINTSRCFYGVNIDKDFNKAFMILSSYLIEDAEAAKTLLSKGLFTSASVLMRHVYTSHLIVAFLRTFPEYTDEWLEESKKDLFSTGKDINPKFRERDMKKKLEEKGEQTGYDLFTVLSKAMHGSPNWGYQFQDLNIFSSPVKKPISILISKSFIATFSELLHMTVGEFLKKYLSELKTNVDIAKLKFRYDDLYKKHTDFRNKLNREIENQKG